MSTQEFAQCSNALRGPSLIYGRYFGIKRSVIRERAGELLEFAQLVPKANDQVSELSGGMGAPPDHRPGR